MAQSTRNEHCGKADRAFFRDTLGFPSVDAGPGWLIFGLPAAEAAFHPAEGHTRHEFYLMCDDLAKEIAALRTKGVESAEVVEARWGSITKIRLPDGPGHGPKYYLSVSYPGVRPQMDYVPRREAL